MASVMWWRAETRLCAPRTAQVGNVLGWAFLCHLWSLLKFHFSERRYFYKLNISALSHLRLNHTSELRLWGLILTVFEPGRWYLLADWWRDKVFSVIPILLPVHSQCFSVEVLAEEVQVLGMLMPFFLTQVQYGWSHACLNSWLNK